MGTITHKYRGVHDVELLEADLDLLKFIHITVVEQGEPMHFQRSLGNTVTTDPGQWAEGFDEGTTLSGGLDQSTFNYPTESNEFILKANELAVQATGMTYQMLLERLETNGASEQEMMYAWDLDDQFYSGVWDYKPENVLTNRQGTWGGDNSEEILAAGGDPRRPGVRLTPDSRTVGVMDQTVLNQLDDSKVPMPEGGQFKRRGLDAILPGSGLEWGLELGLGALLGPTSRIALKKWIDSLGNFVRKTGGGDDVLLSVADDAMADVFSLSNRTNVQVHPSGVVSQIDQAEGTEFVEQFVKDHGREPTDKEIIHWAQGKGNVSDNPIDIGPEGRVQKIKDNVVKPDGPRPLESRPEMKDYPTADSFNRATYDYNQKVMEQNKTKVPKTEETRILMREGPNIESVTPEGQLYSIRTTETQPAGALGQASPWSPIDENPWINLNYDLIENEAEKNIRFLEKRNKLAEQRLSRGQDPTNSIRSLDYPPNTVSHSAVAVDGSHAIRQLKTLGYDKQNFGALVHRQAKDQNWTTRRSSDPDTFLRLRQERARQLKKDPAVPRPKKITMDTPLSPGEVELLITFEHELFHLRFQHRYDFWSSKAMTEGQRDAYAGNLINNPGNKNPGGSLINDPFKYKQTPTRTDFAEAMAEIDAQRGMIDTLGIDPPPGGWPDWMWNGEYPQEIMDVLPMGWKELNPHWGHSLDPYSLPQYKDQAAARLKRQETGGPTIETIDPKEQLLGTHKSKAIESVQRIVERENKLKHMPIELASMATAGFLGYTDLGKRSMEYGLEKYADGADVMINVLAKVGDAIISQAMENSKFLKLNPGIGNQIFGMNAALAGANIIATPNDADALDGIQGSLRQGGHNPQDIMPMDVIEDIKNGDAVVVGYETDADVDKAIEMGQKMGVHVSADLPHIWRKPKSKFALPPKGEPATANTFKNIAMTQMYYPESRKP